MLVFYLNRYMSQDEIAMDTPTVYVIDASAAVRNSVSVLLQQLDIRAKYFADEKNFLNEPRPLPTPRCLIADLNLAAMNGIELMNCCNKVAAQPQPLFSAMTAT